MKNALFFPLLLLSFTAGAQKTKIEYGFQGGINLSTAYGNVGGSLLSRITGLSAGVSVKLNTSNHFGIKALPSYDQLGWAYRSLVMESGLFTGGRSALYFKLDYLNLPILAEYTLGKKVRWNINAGIFAGFLLKSKTVLKNGLPLAAGQSAVVEAPIHTIKHFNFGLAVGTGVQVPLSSKIALDINIRNITGLTNIDKLSVPDFSTKTLTYSLLSGLTFQL